MKQFDNVELRNATDSNKSTAPKIATAIEKHVVEDSTLTIEERNEDIKNHFTDIPIDFLQDITDVFEEFNITDLDMPTK